MKKGCFIALMAMLAGVAPQANAVVIDSFDDGMVDITVNSGSDTERVVESGLGGVLGGERETTAFYSAADSSMSGDLTTRINNLGSGELNMGQDPGVAGWTALVYDGTGDSNDPGTSVDIDFTGLGGVDLTADAHTMFVLDVLFADQSASQVLDIRVYTDENNYSELLRSIDSPIASQTQFAFNFADFVVGAGASGAADFANVGAIVLAIDGRLEPALDVTIDEFRTALIPEPATLMLFGIGLSCAGARRLRKRG